VSFDAGFAEAAYSFLVVHHMNIAILGRTLESTDKRWKKDQTYF